MEPSRLFLRWEQARRCLYGSREWSRWHGAGDDGRTLCGYRVPVAVSTETTAATPRWRLICSRCRRRLADGHAGQLSLVFRRKHHTQTSRRSTMKVIPIRRPARADHVLKCWPEKYDAITRGVARATVRRNDDRVFTVGDTLLFVETYANGDAADPAREIAAFVTRVEVMAGHHQLYGADVTASPRAVVPMALVHFSLEEQRPPGAELVPDDVDDWRKVLAMATSAGDTISEAEAIQLIRSIARTHLSSVRGDA
jgi:hypothetical protein